MRLYDYQQDCVDAIYDALRQHKNTMVQSPTGSGKTVIFNHIATDFAQSGKRVLIIADRKELIQQTSLRLWKDNEMRSGIIMSGVEPMRFLPIQVASIQTLNRRSYPEADLVIIDEARASTANSYKGIFEYYQDAKIIGFDATPIRTSGQGFDHLYTHLIHGLSIKELEQMGKLVPARPFINPIDRHELAKVKVKSTGDYSESELEAFMEANHINADLVESYRKYADGRKVIIFAINIEHSKKIERYYNDAGIKCRHVDGTMDAGTRDAIIRQFRNGDIRALVNVGIATYGFDEKTIDCVQLARPTKSLSLYLQMVGRGSRTATGKTDYILLDNANCIIEHGRPNAQRKWTLKGKKKVKQTVKKYFKVKHNDGEIKVYQEDEIPLGLKGVDMVELTFQYRVKDFDKLYDFAERKGYKKSFAMFKFLEKFPDVSTEEIQYMAKKLRYLASFIEEMAKKKTMKKER